MDLEFATSYFDRFINYEQRELTKKDVNLTNIKTLCAYFDHPELCCPCIHVAGSKGKGSITTMSGSILKAAGFKAVGLYRSPALTHFTDRISEVGGPFSLEIYQTAFKELQAGVDELIKTQKIARPTYCELVTLYAFLVFRTAGCDYAVYEVGAGGRLDATNVVSPAATIINTIELEHTEFLGDTLEQIATEKAGIIKKGVPVVIGPQQIESVKRLFRRLAREKSAGELVFIPDKTKASYFIDDQNHLRMRIEELHTDLRLPGDFQATNALAAETAVRLALPSLPDRAVKQGLETAFLPGRFEILTSSELIDYPHIPYLILDGAHTPRSIEGAIKTLEIYRDLLAKQKTYDSCLTDFVHDRKPLLLFACAKKKKVEEMAMVISDHFSDIILTKPGDFKTADLPRAKNAFKKATTIEDCHKAIETALQKADQENRGLAVLGSFYLVTEVKRHLQNSLPASF